MNFLNFFRRGWWRVELFLQERALDALEEKHRRYTCGKIALSRRGIDQLETEKRDTGARIRELKQKLAA